MSSIAIGYYRLSLAILCCQACFDQLYYILIIPAIRPAVVLHVVVFYYPGLLLRFCMGNMSRAILTIYQVVVKGYHECPFAVEIQKKRGDCSNALKVIDDRSQLGHRKRELVALWASIACYYISPCKAFLFYLPKNMEINDNR